VDGGLTPSMWTCDKPKLYIFFFKNSDRIEGEGEIRWTWEVNYFLITVKVLLVFFGTDLNKLQFMERCPFRFRLREHAERFIRYPECSLTHAECSQNVVETLTDYEACTRKRVGKTKNGVTKQLRDESHPVTQITHRRSHCTHCLLLLSYLVQLQTVANKREQLQSSLLHSTLWLLALARGQHLTSSGSVTIVPCPAAPAASVPPKTPLRSSHSEMQNGSDAFKDGDLIVMYILKMKMAWKQCVQGRVLSSAMWRHVFWYRRFGEIYSCSLGLLIGHEHGGSSFVGNDRGLPNFTAPPDDTLHSYRREESLRY
jgi:hypothetical protein